MKFAFSILGKNFYKLVVIVNLLALTFGCERKTADLGRVVVKLPDSAGLSATNSYAKVGSGVSEKFAVGLRSQVESNSNLINCYFVALASNTSESAFKGNYCGRQNSADGRVQKDYEFGSFVGFVPAGSSIELATSPGEERYVLVFGFHAQNPSACVQLSLDIFSQPSKSSFSNPYLLGKSELFAVVSGTTTNVTVSVAPPTGTNIMDDCVLPAFGRSDTPVADRVSIERDPFLDDILISQWGSATGFRCDYIDIVPKKSTSSGGLQPARLVSPEAFRIKYNNSFISTSASKASCLAGTLDPQFVMNPTDSYVRRWIRLDASEDGSSDRLVEVASLTDSNKFATKTMRVFSNYLAASAGSASEVVVSSKKVQARYSITVPEVVKAGSCNRLMVTRRTLEGQYPVSSAIDSLQFLAEPAGSFNLYSDDDCNTPIVSPQIPAGAWFQANYYFRADQDFEVAVRQLTAMGVQPVPLQSVTRRVQVRSDVVIGAPAESVQIVMKPVVGKASTFLCYPIEIRLLDQYKAFATTPTGAYIQVLWDQMDSALWSNLSLHNGPLVNDCDSNTARILDSTPVTFTQSTAAHKMYLRAAVAAAIGKRVVKFKVFDGVRPYFVEHEFEIVERNLP